MYRKFCITLIVVNVVFIVLHILFGAQFDLFNLDRERTPAAYWSGLQLMAVAALGVGMIFLLRTRRATILWGTFASLFVGFSFDEISELHENITYYVSKAFTIPIPIVFRSPTYNWLIILSPLIVFAFVFLFFFIKSLHQENMRSRKLLVLGVLCFLAAMCFEAASGFDTGKRFLFWFVILEESLELFGETIVLLGMTLLARDRFVKTYARRGEA